MSRRTEQQVFKKKIEENAYERELSHVVAFAKRQNEPNEASTVKTETDETMVSNQEMQKVLQELCLDTEKN